MNRDRLITDNLPFVTSIAKQYVGKGIDLEDLISEGTVGLVRAAEHYDETRGYSFASYSVWWIRQSIQQAIAEQSRIVRVPASQVGTVNRINKLRAMFEQDHGRRPNINEIAESANIPEHRVKETMKASARQVSVDAPFSDNTASTLLDKLTGTDDPSTDSQLLIESLRNELRLALVHLKDRERRVLCAFYGIGEPEATLAEIGERMGITRERARQIRKKAIRHLRSKTTNKYLRSYLAN